MFVLHSKVMTLRLLVIVALASISGARQLNEVMVLVTATGGSKPVSSSACGHPLALNTISRTTAPQVLTTHSHTILSRVYIAEARF